MRKISLNFLKSCLIMFVTLANIVYVLAGESEVNNLHPPAKNDVDSLRIAALCEDAAYFSQILNDYLKSDSLGELAIESALSTYRPGLLLMAYNSYLDNTNLLSNREKALNYALAAERLSSTLQQNSWSWVCCLNLSKVYLSAYDFDKALSSAYKSLTLAGEMNDDKKRVESYLMIGEILERNNQKVEAFRNYLLATKIAKQGQDNRLLKECYAQLSGFYLDSKSFQKAATYKLMEKELISRTKPVDSLALVWIDYDLQVINLNSDETRVNIETVNKILDFAKRHKVPKLKEYEMTLYRSELTKLKRMDLLQQFYTEQYPEEFHKLKIQSPSFYYRLKAYFSEYEGKADSAGFYFDQAEKYISRSSNKVLQSNFYLRYGQFLIRAGKENIAMKKLEKAYHLAKEANYMKFMLGASSLLEKLFAGEKNYRQAYEYANLNRNLNDSLNRLAEKDMLIMMEVNHAAQQQAFDEERERQEILNRHNLQYTAIVIGILAVFIVLILLGSFKVPRWMIQSLGFISFIFLFEFIILLADQKIHHLTHGEPWKILLIKIALIALLLPFHHWIEHKVVHMLLNRRLINFHTFSFRDLFGKKKTSAPAMAED